jgi:hypothetical protein
LEGELEWVVVGNFFGRALGSAKNFAGKPVPHSLKKWVVSETGISIDANQNSTARNSGRELGECQPAIPISRLLSGISLRSRKQQQLLFFSGSEVILDDSGQYGGSVF